VAHVVHVALHADVDAAFVDVATKLDHRDRKQLWVSDAHVAGATRICTASTLTSTLWLSLVLPRWLSTLSLPVVVIGHGAAADAAMIAASTSRVTRVRWSTLRRAWEPAVGPLVDIALSDVEDVYAKTTSRVPKTLLSWSRFMDDVAVPVGPRRSR
jgi:hypothetical protein